MTKKTLDYLAEAANRVLKGDEDGISWVWHHSMDTDAHLKFDGFLVQTNDELAFQAGPPFSRFETKVRRMVELERERRAAHPQRFQLLHRVPGNHRWYRDHDYDRIACADNSGSTPDKTDDGVLWLDTSKPISLNDVLNGGCTPVIKASTEEAHGIISGMAEIIYLVTEHGMAVGLLEGTTTVDLRPKGKAIILYSGDVPDVTLEPADCVEIELRDSREVDQLILDYNGVRVYQAEKDCTLSDYWCAVYPGCWHESDDAFDSRDLDGIPDQLTDKYEELFPGNDLKQVLAYNIDLEVITTDGRVG